MLEKRQRRRALLTALVCAPWSLACAKSARAADNDASTTRQLASLEQDSGVRLGLAALDTGDGRRFEHRANERFPMCSTFKMLAGAAVLARSVKEPGLLARRMVIRRQDLLEYAPITSHHVGSEMTVQQLCAAAISYSDNTAGNLLLEVLGGPAALTAYVRTLSDPVTRLDRTEPELDTAIPGDPRDTTTPAAMLGNMRKLLLTDALPAKARSLLQTWLMNNTTGKQRIRAGVPANWRVGDKTGSGRNGAIGDVAIIWPPDRAPILLTIYAGPSTDGRDSPRTLIASAAKIIASAYA